VAVGTGVAVVGTVEAAGIGVVGTQGGSVGPMLPMVALVMDGVAM
jgi:hypothetical protein